LYLRISVVPVHAMNSYGVTGSIAPLILNFDTRWRRLVSLTARLLHLIKKAPPLPPVPNNGRQRGPQSRSGRFGEEENLLMLGIEPLFLDCPTRILVTIPAELSGLRCVRRNVNKHVTFSNIKHNTEVQYRRCGSLGLHRIV
jgi:hypothetical protein